MKFLAVLSAVALAATAVVADVVSVPRTYNISSPSPNESYVVNRILPCTIKLPLEVYPELKLTISLEGIAPTNGTYDVGPIDSSKTLSSQQNDFDFIFYQHSTNWNIPTTVVPGDYNVVFFDANTYTKTPIPIKILAASAAIPSNVNPNNNASPSDKPAIDSIAGKSIASSFMTPIKTVASLAAVAVVAVFL
ncbi:hypothetical protein BDB01DRAFT_716370 [Pilobolus umbonatus]|nr:hypothetical protein BDB01DRAFT_716370 [Pilobolus umbonatus]